MKIRTATLDDSEKLVPLYQELGYAISLSEIIYFKGYSYSFRLWLFDS